MRQPDTAAKFIEPTLASRLKLTFCVVLGLFLWLAMELWWEPFMAYVKDLPLCESLPWLRGVTLGFVAIFWLAGLSAARASGLILTSGQSPFPNAWVWTRTPVRTGWRARLDGYAAGLIAAACFFGPLAVAYLAKVQFIFCIPESCGC